MLINCSNEESLEKLKSAVEAKFSNKYKIATPKPFKPRLLVSDVEKSLENRNDFLESLVQNNTFLEDCDIKVIAVIKLKYSLNIIIEVDPDVRKQIISCVIYRPPHTPINASVGIIDDMLSFFSPQYDNILILGDINIDLFNHENPLSNCLDSFNFTQLINEPTRVTLHSSTLLDPIFTNTPNKVVNSGTINADFVSDHKTIDEKVVCFTNHLLQLFDIHAPLRNARITKPAAPWLTDNMRSIFNLRDKALTTFQNDPSDTNWAAYKNMRNYSLASFRREKKAYLSRNVDINTRSSWNTLRNMNVCHNKRVEIPFNLLDPQEVNDYEAVCTTYDCKK
nr:unnamed protein product [Callosobruchus chinensis]